MPKIRYLRDFRQNGAFSRFSAKIRQFGDFRVNWGYFCPKLNISGFSTKMGVFLPQNRVFSPKWGYSPNSKQFDTCLVPMNIRVITLSLQKLYRQPEGQVHTRSKITQIDFLSFFFNLQRNFYLS